MLNKTKNDSAEKVFEIDAGVRDCEEIRRGRNESRNVISFF